MILTDKQENKLPKYVICFNGLSQHLPEGVRKTTKDLRRGRLPVGRDSKTVPPEDEAGVSTIEYKYSVRER
jgi:hypothetical protein